MSNFSNECKTVLFGVVYLPPEGSVYAKCDMFEDLENDIININESDLPVCLLGDFNSRTSTMADYNTFDTNLVEVLSNNCNIYDEVLKADLINQYNIDLNRTSSDNVCNAFGMKLLHLCKTFDLYIGNGRLGCDRGIGKTNK